MNPQATTIGEPITTLPTKSPEPVQRESILQKVTTGKIRKPRKMLLYGTPAIGKTTFASQAPNPIFIQAEEGTNDIENAFRLPVITCYQDIVDQIRALYEDEHDFKTVVLDSADWAERYIFRHTYQKAGLTSIEGFGYGKGYRFANENFEKLLGYLQQLVDVKNMSVIIIAHSAIATRKNPSGEDYDVYAPRLHKLNSDMIMHWVDEVGFAHYEIVVQTTTDQYKKVSKAKGNGNRVVEFCEQPHFAAKNRIGITSVLPLNWNAFAAYLNR